MFDCTRCDGTGREQLNPVAADEQRAACYGELGPDDEPPDGTEPCGRCNGTGQLTLEDLNWELDCF